MNEQFNADNVERYRTNFDECFKNAIHNKDILAKIVKELVIELRDESLEDIKNCITPESGKRAQGLDTELINANLRSYRMDNLFRIGLPGGDGIGLLVNIEGQNVPDPGYPILNRALAYASGIIFNQKGIDFDKSDFTGLKKVYGLWLITHPRKGDGGRIWRYHITGSHLRQTGTRSLIPKLDKLEIIIVNLSQGPCRKDEFMDLLYTLFGAKLDDEERRVVVSKKYNIELDDNTLKSLRGLGMSMDEEFQNYYENIGLKKGLEQGRVEGIEENCIFSVKSLSENANLSIEESMDLLNVPADMRETVRKRLSRTTRSPYINRRLSK